jgi:3-hydroxymyristoyl/3-hydroxydecanoyl-(acyl carrier protein) dehydratase
VSAAAGEPFVEITTSPGVVRGRVRTAHAHALCAGHFPGEPLLPGAYQAGLMAELAARGLAAGSGSRPVLLEVVRCEFRARVHPNDDIEIVAWTTADEAGTVQAELLARGSCAARARLRFA